MLLMLLQSIVFYLKTGKEIDNKRQRTIVWRKCEVQKMSFRPEGEILYSSPGCTFKISPSGRNDIEGWKYEDFT